jgi:hypothetical protein
MDKRDLWIGLGFMAVCVGVLTMAVYAAIKAPDCPQEQKTCTMVLMPQIIGKVTYILPQEICSCPDKK